VTGALAAQSVVDLVVVALRCVVADQHSVVHCLRSSLAQVLPRLGDRTWRRNSFSFICIAITDDTARYGKIEARCASRSCGCANGQVVQFRGSRAFDCVV
jgi:hypothetical protein